MIDVHTRVREYILRDASVRVARLKRENKVHKTPAGGKKRKKKVCRITFISRRFRRALFREPLTYVYCVGTSAETVVV